MYNLSNYDFFDLGTKTGGSIEFALKQLGGTKGLGVDIKLENVLTARKRGYDCIHGDATNLDFPDNSFRFVVMSHFLEHLPDLDTVERVIKNCTRISRDFLFIQGPFFDADNYLKNLGLKLYWSDWSGHPTHLESHDLISILNKIGIKKYVFKVRKIITNSYDPSVHPLSSPQDQHEYTAGIHPYKSFIKFKEPVYSEMIFYVPLRNLNNWNKIIKAKKGVVTYYNNAFMLNPVIHFLNKIFNAFLLI